MNVDEQIQAYIAMQPEGKREEMQALHRLVLAISPDLPLWFLDGRNSDGKIVSNPNIGYGEQTIRAAGGESRPFYRIGLSANTTGISIYIIGIEDRTYLSRTYGERLGRASITGYCIKFRRLADLDRDVLDELIRFGLEARSGEEDAGKA